jgi:hypothetical protein
MRQVNVYRVEAGWIWEVRFGTRVVLFGWSETKEQAELTAEVA